MKKAWIASASWYGLVALAVTFAVSRRTAGETLAGTARSASSVLFAAVDGAAWSSAGVGALTTDRVVY